MGLLDVSSLSITIDRISDLLFAKKQADSLQLPEAVRWTASRQGQARSYAGMFAPTPQDYRNGIRVYTGEGIYTGAAIGHILSEESIRVLSTLRLKDKEVTLALDRAMEAFRGKLAEIASAGYPLGTYCCGKCTVAYWRALKTGWLSEHESRIAEGLRALKKERNGSGKWRRFPFYYTCLALSEIGPGLAREEMTHAAGACERVARRYRNSETTYELRRVGVTERILSACI